MMACCEREFVKVMSSVTSGKIRFEALRREHVLISPDPSLSVSRSEGCRTKP
jgi:hypothetical protein